VTRRRFIDTHVHLWDVHKHPWYRGFPQKGAEVLGWTMTAPWQEQFLWEDYRACVASVDLVKWVHVSAVVSASDVEAETAWITEIAHASGAPPFAIIGSLDLNRPHDEIERDLDRQMIDPAFRGIRILGDVDYAAPSLNHLLESLSARGLVYDLAADGATVQRGAGWIAAAARCLERHPDLTVVLEHTGMPLGTDAATFAEWRDALARLAALPNTFCKLSGLMMTIHRPETALFRTFFDTCIELFCAQRCMFGSNFPVDLVYASGETHLEAFGAVADGYAPEDADSLFSGTAERVYRL
jgi:L-fuconolactonase